MDGVRTKNARNTVFSFVSASRTSLVFYCLYWDTLHDSNPRICCFYLKTLANNEEVFEPLITTLPSSLKPEIINVPGVHNIILRGGQRSKSKVVVMDASRSITVCVRYEMSFFGLPGTSFWKVFFFLETSPRRSGKHKGIRHLSHDVGTWWGLIVIIKALSGRHGPNDDLQKRPGPFTLPLKTDVRVKWHHLLPILSVGENLWPGENTSSFGSFEEFSKNSFNSTH